eukprot:3940922-Rhodomonas_salina.7
MLLPARPPSPGGADVRTALSQVLSAYAHAMRCPVLIRGCAMGCAALSAISAIGCARMVLGCAMVCAVLTWRMELQGRTQPPASPMLDRRSHPYLPTRVLCAVSPIRLRACYAMSGTSIAYALSAYARAMLCPVLT